MPKDTVERAIKKATDKDAGDYKEITYEGYGPYGIAIFVEAATDNNTRTVANVRSYFNKHGGNLGTQGSLTFLFEHKCTFKIKPKDGVSLDDLELELIDYGVDELGHDEDEDGNEQIVLYGAFEEYSNIQNHLEENGYEIISSEFVRIPNDLKDVTPRAARGHQQAPRKARRRRRRTKRLPQHARRRRGRRISLTTTHKKTSDRPPFPRFLF